MMKLFFLCFLTVLSCSVLAQRRTVIIANIPGMTGDSSEAGWVAGNYAEFPSRRVEATAKPGKDGKARLVFNLEGPVEGTFYTASADTRLELFLEPGDSLEISYNTADPEGTPVFSGKGAANNRVLYALNQCRYDVLGRIDLEKISPDSLVQAVNTYYQQQQQVLKQQNTGVSQGFLQFARSSIDAGRTRWLLELPFVLARRQHRKISEMLPTGYWLFDKDMATADRQLGSNNAVSLFSYSYPLFLIAKKAFAGHKLDETVPSEQELRIYDTIEKTYKPGRLRSLAMAQSLESLLGSAKKPTDYQHLVEAYSRDKSVPPAYASGLNAVYRRYAAVSAGQVPPSFVLKDLNNKDVTLADLKGKVIYLDVWASWCSPCRAEIKKAAPGLHAKFADNKDVAFVFISIDDSPDKWKEAIKEDKIDGIHLLSPGGLKSQVAQLFNINGIPRYMIIDREGKVFDNDAPRPGEAITADRIREASGK